MLKPSDCDYRLCFLNIYRRKNSRMPALPFLLHVLEHIPVFTSHIADAKLNGKPAKGKVIHHHPEKKKVYVDHIRIIMFRMTV